MRRGRLSGAFSRIAEPLGVPWRVYAMPESSDGSITEFGAAHKASHARPMSCILTSAIGRPEYPNSRPSRDALALTYHRGLPPGLSNHGDGSVALQNVAAFSF